MRLIVSTLLCLGLAACGGEADEPTPNTGSSIVEETPASKPSEPEVPKDPMLDPFTSFAHQLDLLREADLEGLKACMVESAHDQIDVDRLEVIAEHFGTLPAEDYARYVELRGDDLADLMFPSRKVFTTFKRVDGKWLAQSPWWQISKSGQ